MSASVGSNMQMYNIILLYSILYHTYDRHRKLVYIGL